MEEKILIKSEKYDVKKLFKIMVIIGLILTVVFGISHTIIDISDTIDYYNKHEVEWFCITMDDREKFEKEYDSASIYYDFDFDDYMEEVEAGNWEPEYDCDYCLASDGFAIAQKRYFQSLFSSYIWMYLIPAVALTVLGGVVYLWLNSYNLTVTDKRVSGEVLFGKKVDLPTDSISATAIISLLKGVSISTSSGKISFLAIKNASEIHDVINGLLIQRQQQKENFVAQMVEVKTDEADQLKKYKDLLDRGVITQEEFDAKKKQLLDL